MKSHYRKKFKSQTWTECTIAPCWSVSLATSAKKKSVVDAISQFRTVPTVFLLVFVCRPTVWRLSRVSQARTSPTWGGGWDRLSPSKNRVSTGLCSSHEPHEVQKYLLFSGNLVIFIFLNAICLVTFAEKEIPIPVKQEPVEIKEPVVEVDKFKSRYKKFIPPVPPSPVSENTFADIVITEVTLNKQITLITGGYVSKSMNTINMEKHQQLSFHDHCSQKWYVYMFDTVRVWFAVFFIVLSA